MFPHRIWIFFLAPRYILSNIFFFGHSTVCVVYTRRSQWPTLAGWMGGRWKKDFFKNQSKKWEAPRTYLLKDGVLFFTWTQKISLRRFKRRRREKWKRESMSRIKNEVESIRVGHVDWMVQFRDIGKRNFILFAQKCPHGGMNSS